MRRILLGLLLGLLLAAPTAWSVLRRDTLVAAPNGYKLPSLVVTGASEFDGAVTLTGGIASTPTVVASTSVTTPLILPSGAAAFTIGGASTTGVTITTDGSGNAELVVPNSSIAAAEISDQIRSVPLPLNSWFDGTSRAMLSVDDGADAQPDITLTSSVPRIVYDITGGSVDTNEICTTFTVPADYASGGTIVARIKQNAATVTQVETFSCRASVDDGTISAANAANLTNSTSVQTATSTPAITWAAGASIGVCCKQGNASADDAISILSIEGQYTAVQ